MLEPVADTAAYERTAPYEPLGGVLDEMVDAEGRVRPTWSHLHDALLAAGPDALRGRAAEAARLIRTDGATYNVHERGETVARPWPFDPVPHLVPAEEWVDLEVGLQERAQLLDLLLADLYGERTVLRSGVVPPELVYSLPEFLRPAHGIRLAGPQQLILHAVDLVRTAGGVQVLADRTQAPSGAGYALENRAVSLRLLPSLFRDSHVHRFAQYFRTLRATLMRLAPGEPDEPRVVILSPGPRAETYFEHGHLAAYLGLSLVEGADLTVRGGHVFLRSLRGLEPVHVIVRRVDARWSDPLELRPDSRLGVPGLLEACRRGNVSVVNPIGSGVVESPALLPYLPAIGELLMGRAPRLESVPTWWCGDVSMRSHVLAHLHDMVLKPVGGTTGGMPLFCGRLSREELDTVRAVVEMQPGAWAAQRRADVSTMPTFDGDRVVPRPGVLRAHSVASGDGWVVLPGGLTRVSGEQGGLAVSMQAGGTSKDTWVLAAAPVRDVTVWERAATPPRGVEVGLPSRAAENLYWLGRYGERIEQKVRLIRTVARREQDLVDAVGGADLACITALTGALGRLAGVGFAPAGVTQPLDHRALADSVGDAGNPASLRSELGALLRTAHAVRDLLSVDTWQLVLDLEGAHARLSEHPALGPLALERLTIPLAAVAKALHGLAGLVAESFVRDDAWRFLDAGRRLERVLLACSILDDGLGRSRGDAADELLLESVLLQGDSIVTYRSRHAGTLDLRAVLHLLVVDPRNPRAVRHALDRLEEDLAGLPRTADDGRLRPDQQLVLQASTALRVADVDQLARAEPDGERPALTELLVGMSGRMLRTSEELSATYFTHLHTPATVVGGPIGLDL